MSREVPLYVAVALFASSGACPSSENPWYDPPYRVYQYPISEEADATCGIVHLRRGSRDVLLGAVSYLRVGSNDAGNQPIWPRSAHLCYTTDAYDLLGMNHMVVMGTPARADTPTLRVLGSPPLDRSIRSWPITMSLVPRYRLNSPSSEDFTDDSCERIARIEGEFAGDITIHVEPAGPECDRIPYTVRYVAQELYRR